MQLSPVDIVILSNGPGELMTWVRPVVQVLRQRLDAESVRISVVLSPCPHASGREAAIATQFPAVDRVQGPEHFWPFLLWGRTADAWDWHPRGVVVFLGGDQFFTLLIGRHLGYRRVAYAEWFINWLPWMDRVGVTQAQIQHKYPEKYHPKITVVGDLIAEAQTQDGDQTHLWQTLGLPQDTELIGLLPGSKPAKLMLGVPLMIAIAECLHGHCPHTQFVIPVAPTLDLATLAQYADPDCNRAINIIAGQTAQLVTPNSGCPYLLSPNGIKIYLWTPIPAYPLLAQCQLAVTTVGANTAELASLAVPMVVLLPTQKLDVMRAWDGIPGLLANLPGIGAGFARLINAWILKRGLGLRAWPNIWAQREIVPELVGNLTPESITDTLSDLLLHPQKLAHIRQSLKQVRGQPGAATHLATLIQQALDLP